MSFRCLFAFTVLTVGVALAPRSAAADYLEECQHEGCSTEEVDELYESYEEECLHEGCSAEEVIELAGAPGAVGDMLSDFRSRGWHVDDKDFSAGQCFLAQTNTKCIAVVMICQDVYMNCPGGGGPVAGDTVKSAWYACGVCFGFDW